MIDSNGRYDDRIKLMVLKQCGLLGSGFWVWDASTWCRLLGSSQQSFFAAHLASTLGLALVERGWRVFMTRSGDLVQRLQVARRDLGLETAIAKLDKYHLLILDDLAYVSKDQAEASVLFELISARYERRLVLVNQPFGDWGKVFPDPAMTVAVVDRLVHHAVIVEMDVDSYRRSEAEAAQAKGPGRPAIRAAKRNTGSDATQSKKG